MILTAKYANHTQSGMDSDCAGGFFRVVRVVHGWPAGFSNRSTHNYYHADGNGNIIDTVNGGEIGSPIQ